MSVYNNNRVKSLLFHDINVTHTNINISEIDPQILYTVTHSPAFVKF